MAENIARVLAETAHSNGSRTALVEARSGRSCSFEELNLFVDLYGAYLARKGIHAGDRVVLMVRPSIDFIALAFALFRIGAPVILIDPGMGFKNLLRCIQRVKPDYLVGIPAVLLLSIIYFPKFKSVKRRFCCGSIVGIRFFDIRKQLNHIFDKVESFVPDDDSLAAIIFTTGSTGPPKGVRFEHSIFAAQLERIRSYYRIGLDDVDQPGFPLFALFSTALGATAIIPDMDPTKPASVDPVKFVNTIQQFQVTYSFGSPAIWNVVSNYCIENKIRCTSLKKVLMAGAPVSGELIDRVFRTIATEGEVFTPYGATESLPIVSIEGKEVVGDTWEETKKGKGTCVGRPLPGIQIKIIEATESTLTSMEDCRELGSEEIGEIIVRGDVVTRAYDKDEEQTRAHKIYDGDDFWHRLGDVGYLDEQDRLWFCGRKSHRVFSSSGIMYTICCEALINLHPDVFRSALVGVIDEGKFQLPVMIVELHKPVARNSKEIIKEIENICTGHPLTENIVHVLVHDSFPVDIRHNAKIFREKLASWAQEKIKES